MALDITEIRLSRRQEKEVLKAVRENGFINLVLDGERPRFTEESGGDDIASIDLGNDYYERLLATLAKKGIVASKELTKAIEKVLAAEKVYEDGEFFKAVGKIDGATEQAVASLRKQIDQLLETDITPKMRNDYRAVLRKLDKKDYRPDYVEKWAGRLLAAEKLQAYEGGVRTARDRYGDAALLHRLYGRIYVRGRSFKGGERLQWVRLLKPE